MNELEQTRVTPEMLPVYKTAGDRAKQVYYEARDHCRKINNKKPGSPDVASADVIATLIMWLVEARDILAQADAQTSVRNTAHRANVERLTSQLTMARREVKRLAESTAIVTVLPSPDAAKVDGMALLLTNTANALKGRPDNGTPHGWDDLPTLASGVAANIRETLAQLAEANTHIASLEADLLAEAARVTLARDERDKLEDRRERTEEKLKLERKKVTKLRRAIYDYTIDGNDRCRQCGARPNSKKPTHDSDCPIGYVLTETEA